MIYATSPGMHVVFAPEPRLYGWNTVGYEVSPTVVQLRVFELVSKPDAKGMAMLKAVGLNETLERELAFFQPLDWFPPPLSSPAMLQLTSANSLRMGGRIVPLFLGKPHEVGWHYDVADSLALAGLRHGVAYRPSEWSFEGRGVSVEGVAGTFHPAIFEPLSESNEPYTGKYEQWEKLPLWYSHLY